VAARAIIRDDRMEWPHGGGLGWGRRRPQRAPIHGITKKDRFNGRFTPKMFQGRRLQLLQPGFAAVPGSVRLSADGEQASHRINRRLHSAVHVQC
jgi:hypothetical protein